MYIKLRKISAILIAVFILLGFAISSSAEETKTPIYADKLNDGTYSIEVTSSSSMFRIVDCELTVSGDEMNAVMTLSGTGYEKLYMGTGEEALAAGDEDFIYFTENGEGAYTYTVPVEALNADIDCAAFSIRKQEWYDRTLVFEADTLPEGAIKNGINPIAIVIPIVLIIAIVAVIFARTKRKK